MTFFWGLYFITFEYCYHKVLIINVVCLFYQATQVLESKIKKMTETYSTGATTLKELAHMLQRKASSDLEQMKAAISSQTMAVENVKDFYNPFQFGY